MTSIGSRMIRGCAAVVAAVLLAACGGTGDRADGGPAPLTSEEANPHNAVDATFARDMVMHHHQAIDLANLVPGRSTNQAVIAMANNISSQQLPEMAAMTALLTQWNEDTEPAHDHDAATMPGMVDAATMPGMVDAATMAKLEKLTGAPFDKAWLQSMISHHEGAITMAKTEIAQGRNSDMIAMAKNISAVQQTEIDQMKQILGG